MTATAVDDDDVRRAARRSRPATPRPRSGLLPMLHLVQSVEGRITPEGIEACADILGISAAEVSGVATFYTMYKRRPVGDYHVGVCTNTLCAVMGGDVIFERLKDHLDVGNDETTDDGTDHPRAHRVQRGLRLRAGDDGQLGVHGQHDPESATQLVDDLRAGAEVTLAPAARASCTWREAERVLAGFPDGLADEGPAAGPASLVGPRASPARQRLDGAADAAETEQADTGRAETETKPEEGQK